MNVPQRILLIAFAYLLAWSVSAQIDAVPGDIKVGIHEMPIHDSIIAEVLENVVNDVNIPVAATPATNIAVNSAINQAVKDAANIVAMRAAEKRWKSLVSNPLGNSTYPVVVAHRGASCCFPEHTLAAYTHALQLGAHYIEQDVVSTKDGELVVLHDRDLGTVSDVASQGFSMTSKPVLDQLDISDNETEKEYFVEDFTKDEFLGLRSRQRFQFRGKNEDDKHRFVTLRQLFEFSQEQRNQRQQAPFGLYIELKRPTYFRSIGLPLEEKFFELMKEYHYILPQGNKYVVNPSQPLIIQCFEGSTLKYFKDRIEGIPTIHLIKENLETLLPDNPKLRYKDLLTDEGLKFVATYADGIGPHKTSLLEMIGQGRSRSTGLVARAHAHGLVVHPYTFRSDNPQYLPPQWGIENGVTEILLYLKEGIDGFFTDFPADGLEAYEVFTHPSNQRTPTPAAEKTVENVEKTVENVEKTVENVEKKRENMEMPRKEESKPISEVTLLTNPNESQSNTQNSTQGVNYTATGVLALASLIFFLLSMWAKS